MWTKSKLYNRSKLIALSLVLIITLVPNTALAAPSPAVREAQTILTKFKIPIGPIDGVYGAQTARGLCAFRYLIGVTPSRANVSSGLLKKLREYNKKYTSLSKIPAPTRESKKTYLVAHEHCQAMLYAENGYYKRVFSISTGIAGHPTPNGSFWMGSTIKGWSCSTLWPESCRDHSKDAYPGRFIKVSRYGNMYNKRILSNTKGATALRVHGSTSVPTKPDSHGCIRVRVQDSDWMYDHVGNEGRTRLFIVGQY